MALPPQQFCVRWNSYHTNLQAVFPRLLLTEQFADVTLACESRQLRCHKLVLSACSAYLERLLLQNPCKHPIVLMRDMRFSEMQALVDFMYKGEVNVTQEELPSLLKSAEALQIRGLCSGEGGGAGGAEGADASRDFTLASDALLHAHRSNAHPQQPQQQPASKPLHSTSNGPKKRKSEEREREKAEVKEETVEEDGLYYGELDNDHLEYNEDDETGKPGSSLGQSSGRRRPCLRVKPDSELFFQTKLQNLEYMNRLSKMNAAEIQNEFSKYGLTDMAEDNHNNSENDYYKSWLEQNGELEVSLLKANQLHKPKRDAQRHASEVELIPRGQHAGREQPLAKAADKLIRKRGRPPIFKDKNVDIGETVLKADLDQFLEGKESGADAQGAAQVAAQLDEALPHQVLVPHAAAAQAVRGEQQAAARDARPARQGAARARRAARLRHPLPQPRRRRRRPRPPRPQRRRRHRHVAARMTSPDAHSSADVTLQRPSKLNLNGRVYLHIYSRRSERKPSV
ncbi:protein tramtrack, beta isoform-like isoform X3 [Maniola jurtina]|uniref:protein tramtrack, beta isoform-like isoform X3 n=1 Tax=Maniola jurtina TaxID=191418 RepID=UPI001E68869B|nr:protein tramtrack, beta isoform-like isoform X3 [Maniola jurtina]